MDNVGDWIYIVFLIVAAISGLFSSKNKKSARHKSSDSPVTTHTRRKIPLREKVFGKFWRRQLPLKSRKHQLHRSIKRKKKTPASKPFLSTEQEIQKSKVSSSQPMNFPAEEEHSMLEDIEFNNAEELRKAVIYSEILNRKY